MAFEDRPPLSDNYFLRVPWKTNVVAVVALASLMLKALVGADSVGMGPVCVFLRRQVIRRASPALLNNQGHEPGVVTMLRVDGLP
jgi:hypothetical protein